MAKTIRDKVIDYRLYRDNEYTGTTTVDLPEISALADTIKGAGVAGEIEMPVIGQTGSMTTTLNFNTVEPGATKLMAPKFHAIELRFAQQKFDPSTANLDVESIRIAMRAMPKTLNRGSLEPGAAMGGSLEMEVVYYKEVVDGKVNFEIDKLNNIYIIDGIDYSAKVRKALGE